VSPIIAVTSHSEGSPFLTSLFEIGISTFVGKPIVANQRYFLEKVQGAFARAGRDDHGKCAALLRRPAAGAWGAVAAEPVLLAIDGKVTTQGRSVLEVNGEARTLQDSKFVVLLRAVLAREGSLEGWSSGDALGLGTSRSTASAVGAAFAGHMPPRKAVLERDRRGNHRLNPLIVVARIAWDALAEHPDVRVRKLAIERRKRVAKE
jgi:hypothetical protein